MTNVNATVTELAPLGGATNSGLRMGFLNSVNKAAQSDTITVTNADAVEWVQLSRDTDGVAETATLATNVITLTNVNTGAVSGLVFYRRM